MLGLELVYGGLCGVDLRLEGRFFDLVEEIARFDLGPLDEEPLFEEASDARDEGHPVYGLDAADKFITLGDLLPLGPHHSDRRRSAGS